MIPNKPAETTVSQKYGRSPFWIRGIEQSKTTSDEMALAIFQPDILISQQFLTSYQRTFPLDPERTLMLAILEDAVICFQTHLTANCKRKQTLFLDAQQWILSADDAYLFSFENVCATLGLDAAYLRQGLMRWREAAVEKRSATSSIKRHAG